MHNEEENTGAVLDKRIRNLRDKICKAVDCIERYGPIDGAHHKDWVLQEAYRILRGMSKEELKMYLEESGWEPGIPP